MTDDLTAVIRELQDGFIDADEASALLACIPRPCSWGDDAWHRAVSRLIRIHRPDYRRLLAEERGKTGGTT